MDDHLLGSTCALLAAVAWAFAMILFKRSGEKFPPLALNLFKNAIAILLLAVTLGSGIMGEVFGTLKVFSSYDVWILVLSGIIGITLSDTLFFYSLNLVGVGLQSIVLCLYSPFVILFSWLLLTEALSPFQYAGAGLVIFAVLLSSRHAPPPGRSRLQLATGIFLGALAMALSAFGIVLAKPVLNEVPMFSAATIRILAGSIALLLIVVALPQRRSLFLAFRPSRYWKVSIPGSVLGAYLAFVLWIGGFKYTHASIAGVLNQTSSIFALILAILILKEAFTRRKLTALILAMAGILLVFLC